MALWYIPYSLLISLITSANDFVAEFLDPASTLTATSIGVQNGSSEVELRALHDVLPRYRRHHADALEPRFKGGRASPINTRQLPHPRATTRPSYESSALTLCPVGTEVTGKRAYTFLFFRIAASLSKAAYHCTLAGRGMTHLKVVRFFLVFSPPDIFLDWLRRRRAPR